MRGQTKVIGFYKVESGTGYQFLVPDSTLSMLKHKNKNENKSTLNVNILTFKTLKKIKNKKNLKKKLNRELEKK